MSTEMFIQALSGIVTLSIFLAFFYWRWQHYVTDVTRQRLFELRDKLFDYALDHEQFSKSQTSKDVRELLNGMIRFTHEIDIAHLGLQFLFIYFGKNTFLIKKAAASVEELLNGVPEPDRATVQKIIQDAHFVISWHLLRRSLSLILLIALLVPLVLLVLIFFVSTDSLIRLFNKKVGRLINAMAYTEASALIGS